jgi:multicomponent Na+:H+ antiporter subunit G
MTDVIIMILSALGVLFIILAGIGMLKMPDFYMRVSISTKAITLGVGLILIASAVSFNEFSVTSRVIAIIIFIILTAPVAAHMIGRAAYFSKVELWKNTVQDDLKGKYDMKTHTLKSENQVLNNDTTTNEDLSKKK